MKRTPFYSWHLSHGAKMMGFHGWQMPLQYTGIHAEHRAVRNRAGLFDVSHMGRLAVRGPDAPVVVDRLTTNWASRLAVHEGHYSLLCDGSGGILDDLVVYRWRPEELLLCVNAGNREPDDRWLREQIGGRRAEVVDLTLGVAQLALQGPRAEEVLQRLTAEKLIELPYYSGLRGDVAGVEVFVSRTGYTGEDGFELYVPQEHAERIWTEILTAGEGLGIQPAGLGARDTLRLEMGYVLYGNDISPETTPLEAGLGWLIKWDKGEFIGREALWRQKQEGVEKRLVCFEMKEGGIPRPGYRLWSEGRPVGNVTSGNRSPSLGKVIGMGYVHAHLAAIGTSLEVEIRHRRAGAEVVRAPFYPSRAKRSAAK